MQTNEITLTDSDLQIVVDYAKVDSRAVWAGYRAMVRSIRRGGAYVLASEGAAMLLMLGDDERRALSRIRDTAGKAALQSVARGVPLLATKGKRGRPSKATKMLASLATAQAANA